MTANGDDDTTAGQEASATERDPDMGADMSDTGGAQWDAALRHGDASDVLNERGLEGLGQKLDHPLPSPDAPTADH